ncbi:AAA domain-containing protein [Actinophytocola gossypii]|uniref:AAA family ATPase n=1 Tax=Actinophytocola gossypii TaxID=2812003 RepID=A0ABT2J3J6_9PSEU|nr:AAA domain-containing protein [Actinophytocola gossypii]MCT2582363.1 AAA family ATPase [Actinophytocola gossypii]
MRDKVRRLMGVLRQLAVAKTRPIRSITAYEEMLLLADAAEHLPVRTATEPGDEILRADRVRRDPEPPCPRVVVPWVERVKGSLDEPVLRDRVVLPGASRPSSIADHPDVTRQFSTWMRDWRPWAAEERRRRPRAELFQKLFDLHRIAQERPESIEIVVAAGLLHAPGEQGEAGVRVHLLTQAVSVEQDQQSGAMVCTLMPESAVRIEAEEVLAGLEMFDQSGTAVLRDRLLETVSSPLDPAAVAYLKEWAGRALVTGHTVSDDWALPSGQTTQLGFAPALVARRRGAFALREYYDAITKSLNDEDTPVPLGLAQLVEAIEPADRLAWLERTGEVGGAALAEDPLFPLPANDDQAQIIGRLGGDSGVVVEGPPGTGKTHTIANLVSALLASGQRILVTAEKAQALRVLRDKLPPQMQDLCVSLTDASARGNSDLARSVAALAGAKTDFNPAAVARRIADLTARRGGARARQSRIVEDIRALRESETYRHPEIAPGYGGTLADIARQSTANAEVDGWIPGQVSGQEPLSSSEILQLVELMRTGSDQRRSRRDQRIPKTGSLPSDTWLAKQAETVARGDSVRADDASGLVAVLGALPGQVLHDLDAACRRTAEATAALRAAPTDAAWALHLTDSLLAGTSLHLWQRATGQLPLVDDAIAHDQHAGFVQVSVSSGLDPEIGAGVFERFAAHLGSGGQLRKVFKSDEQKAVEALGDAVLVAGTVPSTSETATTAARHLRVLALARILAMGFAPLGLTIALDLDRGSLVERLRQVRHVCSLVDAVLAARTELVQPLSVLPATTRPPLTSVERLDLIGSVTSAVADSMQAALARAEVDRTADEVLALVPTTARPPELMAVADAIKTMDPHRYVEALISLEHARTQQRDQHVCDELDQRLAAAAPGLRIMLAETPDDPAWSARLTRWSSAWAWACARTWLDQRAQPGLEDQLDAELHSTVRDVSVLTVDLAAAKAWKASMERMSARQVQALQSYRSAMANVGKGTGKYAEKFRQAAREAMVVAQGAVPAWVMPVQQVLASIPAEPNAFDVVIVDEASQAELTSSFLLWLAPRVIVVGDDKQCTPPEIGAGSLDPIFQRLDTELPDVPQYLRADLTPKSSVFSMLRSRFGQMVRLREHFRCMPEIIAWSSNEFYRDAPLVPVRQFGADRLPPLRTTYVDGGYVEGQNATLTNPAEARAIADSVLACLEDPAYEGKTFGVVVLQGQSQVDVITAEISARMSAEDWDRRRFRVGTPPDFQGDERHVVWLSLVVAPEQNFAALTRDEFRRRFNVAASRAQDQLWLFHSVTADLLRTNDLRHSLLTYMLSTGSAPLSPALTDVSADVRQPPFDSLFEQRVFLDISARGYHVTPQVETNGRRIDLVVTGAAGKLAVECDGDAFHTTPEQRAADLQREQELKRCGWTFWRVRESQYYLNRERALSSLWPTLDRLGIGPHATGTDAPETVWTPTRTALAPDEAVQDDLEPDEIEAVESVPVVAVPIDPVVTAPPPPSPTVSDLTHDELTRSLTTLANAGPLSSAQVAEEYGMTTAEAREVLTRMVSAGLLERTGQTRGTRYVLPGSVASTGEPERLWATRTVVTDEDRARVLHAAGRQALTNEIVRDLLGVDADAARTTLAAMVAEGLLDKQGQRRGTRYVLAEPRAEQQRAEPEVLDDPELRAVWELAAGRSINNADVRTALRVSANHAQDLLRALYEGGLLDRRGPRGERRYSRRT